jgi:FtsZ-binding cell division protein ZapB
MAEKGTNNLEQMERLETKIDETVKKIKTLNSRCDTLSSDNEMLLEQLETVRGQNKALTRQIDELKAEAEAGHGDNKEDIIRRIDRMLEKFGELQI